MDSIVCEGVAITYTVVRRRRKTVGITVSMDKGVSVAAPLWISDGQIREIMMQKAGWICKKLEQLRAGKAFAKQKEFTGGERFSYLGEEYPLDLIKVPGKRFGDMVFDGTCFQVGVPEVLSAEARKEKVRGLLQKWYADAACRILQQRIEYFSKLVGAKPSKVVLRGQKTRWGSCSGRGSISLNWKMIMAPIGIIDYIVLHELCHLIHLNHSKKFWALVEKYMPDHKARRKWLKLHNDYLEF